MGRESGRVCTAAKARGAAAHVEGEKGGKRDEREKHRRDRQRREQQITWEEGKGEETANGGKRGAKKRRQENAEEGQGNKGKRGVKP